MQPTMENGGCLDVNRITVEDVLSKLKDDGDFDKLRLKIIRKLKENEELRNSIMLMVKQSTALNRPGAENMKPRQLSDAIHQEVGGEVMNRISDGVWDIIRSEDGMKAEIKETVQSVYNKLFKQKENEDIELSTQKLPDYADPVNAPGNGTKETLPDCEPPPPGFCMHDLNNQEEQASMDLKQPQPLDEKPMEGQKDEHLEKDNVLDSTNLDPNAPPGFQESQTCDHSDEDPDVPPGFG